MAARTRTIADRTTTARAVLAVAEPVLASWALRPAGRGLGTLPPGRC